jgi:hypothetical protein
MSEHYSHNREAVNRIGISFLVFYFAGQLYLQKVRALSP